VLVQREMESGRSLLGEKPENTGVYVGSLAKPDERSRVLISDTKAIYASGGDGRDYLVWQRGGKMVAQQFDASTLQFSGEVRTLADRVATAAGELNAAVSGGLLLYGDFSAIRQFAWFDRVGKRLGVVGEPSEYGNFRLSPDGRHLAASRAKPGGWDLWLLDVDRGGVASLLTSTEDSDEGEY
jgi:hypothetical protein